VTGSGEAAIPAERLTVITLLEARIAAVAGRTRARLRGTAHDVHPDLQPYAVLLLCHLDQYGQMTVGLLAARLSADRSVVSRQIRQLDQLGLVRVRIDPADRRNRIIALTRQAEERLNALGLAGTLWMESQLSGWETADLALLVSYLGRLLADVNL
jgi:DNA-binding MarR family transcriptional regulator